VAGGVRTTVAKSDLEGRVRIAFADGSDVELGVGDMASIPAGLTTTWLITTAFKEMWVLAGS
jgi:uncharacterized cupin superfamily protein